MARRVPPRTRGMRRLRAEASVLSRTAWLPAQEVLYSETAGGATLMLATVAALVWANSPWSQSYFDLWKTPIVFDLGIFELRKDAHHWINDGLMAIFFFVVGLEIKAELVNGALSSLRRAALPMVAALGGMLMPAGIYLLLNYGGEGSRGWGVPMATDIAFAVSVLALLGQGIPPGLRVFLLALAVVDDIGAILVIALFYTESISWPALGAAAALFLLLGVLRRLGARSLLPYIVLSVLFWMAVLKSGVHATIAGVILGISAPVEPAVSHEQFAERARKLLERFRRAHQEGDEENAEAAVGQLEELTVLSESRAERLQRKASPWVNYLVLPLFALANAGVVLSADAVRQAVSSPVTLGIVLGLLVGKLVGCAGFSWLAVRAGLAEMPPGVGWSHVLGAGMLAGIGFTVSLFISGLAFTEPRIVDEAKLGILAASVLAGLVGYLFLRARVKAEPA